MAEPEQAEQKPDGWWESAYETTTLVRCKTTASDSNLDIEVRHEWSPIGAQRFVELVEKDFFTDIALFRCVEKFLCQFGVAGDAEKRKFWDNQGELKDDPNLHIPVKRGVLSYAGGGPNTRSHQLFIANADLDFLGKAPWETPLGVVVGTGMEDVVDKWYKGYGDQKGFNDKGVDQGELIVKGNAYTREQFPLLDYIKECKVIKPTGNKNATPKPAQVVAAVTDAVQTAKELGPNSDVETPFAAQAPSMTSMAGMGAVAVMLLYACQKWRTGKPGRHVV